MLMMYFQGQCGCQRTVVKVIGVSDSVQMPAQIYPCIWYSDTKGFERALEKLFLEICMIFKECMFQNK